MIQKAIVESIENNYQVKVRIPKYDKMSNDGVGYNDLSTGIICAYPGTLVSYAEGDVVLIGFENDELSKPVVLGLLYTDRETSSEVQVQGISDTLQEVTSTIETISNRTNYLHIKYSNDAGNTFTSLYDYSENNYENGVFYRENIPINKLATFVSWDITDKNHNVSKDKFLCTVQIHTSSGKEIESNDYYIEIPDTYRYEDYVTISYKISPISEEIKLSDYVIALYTDKDAIGTVEGDYIGIYYSNSSVAPLISEDYSWLSIKTRIQKFIDEAYNSLLTRVQKNEQYLYGKSQEDVIDTELGINSAIEVEKTTLNLDKKQVIQLSNLIKLDTTTNTMYFSNIGVNVTDNGDIIIS